VIKGFLEKWTLKQVQGDGDIEGNGDDGGVTRVAHKPFPHAERVSASARMPLAM
jgi:hypothetical protein